METASLYIHKVGVVLSGTMSHMIMSDEWKLHKQRVGARILIEGKSTKAVEICWVLIKTRMIKVKFCFILTMRMEEYQYRDLAVSKENKFAMSSLLETTAANFFAFFVYFNI